MLFKIEKEHRALRFLEKFDRRMVYEVSSHRLGSQCHAQALLALALRHGERLALGSSFHELLVPLRENEPVFAYFLAVVKVKQRLRVFSELDRFRTAALFEALPPGQAILTTAVSLPEGADPACVLEATPGTVTER